MNMNDLSFMDESEIENLKSCISLFPGMREQVEDGKEFWFGQEDEIGISITPNDKVDHDLILKVIELLETTYIARLKELGETV